MTIVDINRNGALLLTTEEVLAYLRVTPRTIYRLIHSGELPAMRIGRQWRFRRNDLDAWLERQRPACH
jgi:excisionase family DNA binding protein